MGQKRNNNKDSCSNLKPKKLKASFVNFDFFHLSFKICKLQRQHKCFYFCDMVSESRLNYVTTQQPELKQHLRNT